MRTNVFFIFVVFTVSTFAQPFSSAEAIVKGVGGFGDLRVADMDLDGDNDVIFWSGNQTISWAENLGSGQMSDLFFFDVEVNSVADFTICDIDVDGSPDLVFVVKHPLYGDSLRSVVWLPNQGEMSFGDSQSLGEFGFSGITDFHDLDNDGDQDLLMWEDNEVTDLFELSLLENFGGGNFGPAQILASQSSQFFNTNFIDMDFDGDTDIGYGKSENWLQQDAAMQFSEQTWPVPETTVSGQFADFNSDGALDYIASDLNNGLRTVRLYMSAIDSSFSTNEVSNQIDGYGGYSIKSVKDIDADGDLDYVLFVNPCCNASAGNWGHYYYARLNDGQGVFSSTSVADEFQTNIQNFQMVDVNGDEIDDVFYSFGSSLKMRLSETDSWGSYTQLNSTINVSPLNKNIYFGELDAVDMDGDSDLDLVTRSQYFENDGNGNFIDTINLTSSNHFVDLTGDGLADHANIWKNYTWNYARFYENQGDETFEQYDGYGSDTYYVLNCSEQIDLENDGDMDFVAGTWSGFRIYENQLDSFVIDMTYASLDGYQEVFGMDTGDMDGDGYQDVILLGKYSNQQIRIAYNGGDGTFDELVVVVELVLERSHNLKVIDLDQDGDLDIVYSSEEGRLTWHENIGNGEFGPLQLIFQYGNYNKNYEFGDVDGDGDLDIVSNIGPEYRLYLYINQGELNFTAPQVLDETDNSPSAPMLLNIDGDGDLDLYYYALGDKGLYVMENNPEAGCMDDTACNYNSEATSDNGDCCYSSCGCTDDLASNYVFEALCDDGTCEYLAGCMDPIAMNFDSTAAYSDGSCLYEYGCMHSIAENYNPIAVLPDSCIYIWGCTNAYAENYDFAATMDDGSCYYIEGCTFPLADNYNPSATQDDGSCFSVEGCTDSDAQNYNPYAELSDASCYYKVVGRVFHDLDENGSYSSSSETPLALQTLTLYPDSIILLTGDNGWYIFPEVYPGSYSLVVDSNPLFPYYTNSHPYEFTITSSNRVKHFGLLETVPIIDITANIIASQNALCNSIESAQLCFRNTGNVTFDGVLAFTYDQDFSGHTEISPVDSVLGNTVYMSFSNLEPSEQQCFSIQLNSPSELFIGETLDFELDVSGILNGDTVATGHDDGVVFIGCAYDPNDKQVNPTGYTEQHFVNPDTRLEYLIRFQNTGNFQAEDIHVLDTIDEGLDLSTFSVLTSSDNVYTQIYPEERLVDFFFENIDLPDSIHNEPESHGFVSYSILPQQGLEPSTVLNNMASIYFDFNQPILTNETWSTIVDCSLMPTELQLPELCAGNTLSIDAPTEFVETFIWISAGDTIGMSNELNVEFETPGSYPLILELSNPLCSSSIDLVLEVGENIQVDILGEDSICQGFAVNLSALDGLDLTWYFNNEPFSSESQVEVGEEGLYTVVSGSGFCVSEPDSLFLTVLSSPEVALVSVGDGVLSVLFDSGFTYQWFFEGELLEGAVESSVQADGDGEYLVLVTNQLGCTSSASGFYTAVGLIERHDHSISLFPNPSTGLVHLDLRNLSGQVDLSVWSVKGVLIEQEQLQAGQVVDYFNMALTAGKYFIRISTDDREFPLELIIE